MVYGFLLSNLKMSPATLPDLVQEPREGEKAALIKLLGDDDPAVYQAIRSKIISYGVTAAGWLQRSKLSSDPLIRRRANDIIQTFSRQTADNRFLGFCLSQSEELDLEQGVLLLAQTQYPDINLEAYQALLDSYALDVKEALQPGATGESIIATLNHFFFDQLGYHGNEENYYDPENSYLNRVMDRRTGNPISLCTLFLLVGARLKLPIAGIGMPGHFLCRYQNSTEGFFIDAFNRGKLLSKGECVAYLRHTRESFKESDLAPVTPRRILLRVCSNLHQIYTQLAQTEEMSRLQRYIVALAK